MCSSKTLVIKWKGMPHSGCKYLKFKGIVSMIYFKSSAINRKNTDNVIKKWAKNLDWLKDGYGRNFWSINSWMEY